MADKKITELSSMTSASQEDLFVVVDDPTGTPITRNITVGNLFANVGFTQSTNASTLVPFRVTATAATSNISSELVGAKFQLVIANSSITQLGSGVGNNGPYGISIEHSNTVVRTANAAPVAFINLSESFSGNGSHSTSYLLDIGKNGNANVSANVDGGDANTTVLFSNASSMTTTHKLRIRVNGADYWIPLSNSTNL